MRVIYEQREALGDRWHEHVVERNKQGDGPMALEDAADLTRYLTEANSDPDSVYEGRIRNVRVVQD